MLYRCALWFLTFDRSPNLNARSLARYHQNLATVHRPSYILNCMTSLIAAHVCWRYLKVSLNAMTSLVIWISSSRFGCETGLISPIVSFRHAWPADYLRDSLIKTRRQSLLSRRYQRGSRFAKGKPILRLIFRGSEWSLHFGCIIFCFGLAHLALCLHRRS